MNSALKLTRQGVRDLDFGWKKKPVPTAQDVALGAIGVVNVNDGDLGVVAGEEPAIDVLVETADHGRPS